MRFFGHLIKGEILRSKDNKIGTFPDMNRGIEEPRILFALALQSQGTLSRFIARYFSGMIPEKVPEIRLLKDYIRVYGYPDATKDELDDIIFAEYAIGGVYETAIACNEAHEIRHLMHRELHESGKGLSLQDRVESVPKMQNLLMGHYNEFREIGIAEGTPVKLFDWQTIREGSGVFDALTSEMTGFWSAKLLPTEVPCAKEDERTVLYRYPFGAVGIFPPYNAAIGLGFLAIFSSYFAGNATVVRTPSKMPLTNMEVVYVLRQLMEDLDFPISAFQAVIGPAREIAQYMITESPLNSMVYYGDSDVGLNLMAQAIRRGIHFVPELAGSGASLVWKDVDVDKVTDFISDARFLAAGQICLAVKRLFLHEAIYEEFIESLVEKSEKRKVGVPADPHTDLAILGARALYQITDMIEEAIKKGAKIRVGGYRINVDGERDPAGLFYKPTILTDVPLDCQIWYRETFGPVLPIMKIRTFEEAIAQANNSPYGLRTSIFSDTPEIWQRYFDEIEVPGVVVNSDHLYFDEFFPHLGGLKTSGVFGGKYFFEVLTYLKYCHFPR